jgi:hypothetical protein
MNALIAAGAIGLLCAAPAYAEPAHWYIAHMESEVCVPVADIGPLMDRKYYGCGAGFRTPEDVLNYMSNVVGFTYTLDAARSNQHALAPVCGDFQQHRSESLRGVFQ